MKKLLTILALAAMISPTFAADKKDKKEPKKEMPANMYSLVLEGTDNAEIVKTMLSYVKDLNVESCELKDGKVEAVVSSKKRISRSDITKVQKEHKELKDIKVTDLKTKRPEKEKKDSAPDKKATDKKETPKEEPKKAGTDADKKPAPAADPKEKDAAKDAPKTTDKMDKMVDPKKAPSKP